MVRWYEDVEEQIFEALVEESSADGDLTEKQRDAEPQAFLRHIGALAGSKLADGLIDPKLVLAWLLTHLGAGAFCGSLLVPVREAGALLPQLFTAVAIHGMAQRKWAWAAGALGQGLMAALIVGIALTMQGPAAGGAVVLVLGALAVARSVCSVSYKDVLGKTVGRNRRGTATGMAAALASVGVIVFAGLLILGVVDRETLVISAIALSAMLWTAAAAIFATMPEEPQPDRRGKDDAQSIAFLRVLAEDAQLMRFIVVRGLLVGTALAPPYLVLLSRGENGDVATLGLLVLASAVASLFSSFVWGRMSDRSSRKVLIWSGLSGALALMLAVGCVLMGVAYQIWAIPAVLFGLMIAYHGVRQGRSTYLVDMAPEDQRARYTAISNTVLGVVLLVAGAGFAALATWSILAVVSLFAAMCAAAAVLAIGLEEVE